METNKERLNDILRRNRSFLKFNDISQLSSNDQKWLIERVQELESEKEHYEVVLKEISSNVVVTKELREDLPYMDGDSWFCSTVPRLLDSLDNVGEIAQKALEENP